MWKINVRILLNLWQWCSFQAQHTNTFQNLAFILSFFLLISKGNLFLLLSKIVCFVSRLQILLQVCVCVWRRLDSMQKISVRCQNIFHTHCEAINSKRFVFIAFHSTSMPMHSLTNSYLIYPMHSSNRAAMEIEMCLWNNKNDWCLSFPYLRGEKSPIYFIVIYFQ